MTDTGKWFKSSPLGGFRRQDVINYIEDLLKKHHEEVEAYRAGADLLRRERDEARGKLAAFQAQTEEADRRIRQVPTLQSDMDSLKARITQLTIDKTRLSENLQKLEGAREADRTALSRLQFLLSEKEVALEKLRAGEGERKAAAIRAEEIIYQAREQATAIEAEAREEAGRLREQISRLWLETKKRFAALCGEAEEASTEILRDLDRTRVLLMGMGQLFDVIGNRLEDMPLAEQSVAPMGERQKPLAGEPSSPADMLAQQKRFQSRAAHVVEETPGEHPEEQNDR